MSVFSVICWGKQFFILERLIPPTPISPRPFDKSIACAASDYIELLKHNQTVNRLVYHRTIRHVLPYRCQRNTQAAASFTTFVWDRGRKRDTETHSETDGTAVLLNLDRKVVKLDLWLISSVTLRFHGSYDASQHVIGWVERGERTGGGRRQAEAFFKSQSPPVFFFTSKFWCNNNNRNVH